MRYLKHLNSFTEQADFSSLFPDTFILKTAEKKQEAHTTIMHSAKQQLFY